MLSYSFNDFLQFNDNYRKRNGKSIPAEDFLHGALMSKQSLPIFRSIPLLPLYKLRSWEVPKSKRENCKKLAWRDLIHNGWQIKHASVLMLITLSSLDKTGKFQENICFKMRAVGLINRKTKECKRGRHLRKWSMLQHSWRMMSLTRYPSRKQKTKHLKQWLT